MTPASTRLTFSLCFCKSVQTLAQVGDYSPLVQSTPTTSSEHWGGLNCVSRYSPRSSLMASEGFTVHSQKSYSKCDQAQSISNDYQSNHEKYEFYQSPKYFEIRPSQPRNIENFEGGSVGCLKITEDKSSKSRVQTPDAGLVIATNAGPRRED